MNQVIVDTGPIVAYLRAPDHYHAWARHRFEELAPPFWTCEPVLTEAAFLLSRFGGAQNVEVLLALVRRGALRVTFSLADQVGQLLELMKRYQDVPMSLADACLVRMAELRSGSVVLTLDSDFTIYRIHGRTPIPLLIPAHEP